MPATKKQTRRVFYGLDANGALRVDALALLSSAGFRKQLEAASKVILERSKKEHVDESGLLAKPATGTGN